jgi:hypothetical protein
MNAAVPPDRSAGPAHQDAPGFPASGEDIARRCRESPRLRTGLRGEAGVAALVGDQAGVGAGFDDPAMIKDDDLVGVSHG